MSYSGRMRSTSGFQAGSGSGQSPALVVRINEKKLELENLRELRDLSAQMAGQMEMLEEKLATLANGTEAVATILSNWHNVLRAIRMASMKLAKPAGLDDAELNSVNESGSDIALPQTLIRIPIQQTKPGAT